MIEDPQSGERIWVNEGPAWAGCQRIPAMPHTATVLGRIGDVWAVDDGKHLRMSWPADLYRTEAEALQGLLAAIEADVRRATAVLARVDEAHQRLAELEGATP